MVLDVQMMLIDCHSGFSSPILLIKLLCGCESRVWCIALGYSTIGGLSWDSIEGLIWLQCNQSSTYYNTGDYSLAVIVVLGAVSYAFYLWYYDESQRKRKPKFAKNDGPIQLPEELRNAEPSNSVKALRAARTPTARRRAAESGTSELNAGVKRGNEMAAHKQDSKEPVKSEGERVTSQAREISSIEPTAKMDLEPLEVFHVSTYLFQKPKTAEEESAELVVKYPEDEQPPQPSEKKDENSELHSAILFDSAEIVVDIFFYSTVKGDDGMEPTARSPEERKKSKQKSSSRENSKEEIKVHSTPIRPKKPVTDKSPTKTAKAPVAEVVRPAQPAKEAEAVKEVEEQKLTARQDGAVVPHAVEKTGIKGESLRTFLEVSNDRTLC
ncbi:hypothetical protein ANCCAN_00979, partial [Ancylostoma caninum]